MLNPVLRCGRIIGESLRDRRGLSRQAERARGDPPAGGGGDSRRVGRRPLPVPALRGDAAAGRDCRRAGQRSARPDRRRAVHRAGRNNAAGHPGADQADPGGARDEPDPHHPRPAGRVRDLRPHLRALRGLGHGRGGTRPNSTPSRSTPTATGCFCPSRRRTGGSGSWSRSLARCPPPTTSTGCCTFAPRCRWAAGACLEGAPALQEVAPGRFSSCVRISTIRADMVAVRRLAEREVTSPPEGRRSLAPLIRWRRFRRSSRGSTRTSPRSTVFARGPGERGRRPSRRIGIGKDDPGPSARRPRPGNGRPDRHRRHQRHQLDETRPRRTAQAPQHGPDRFPGSLFEP